MDEEERLPKETEAGAWPAAEAVPPPDATEEDAPPDTAEDDESPDTSAPPRPVRRRFAGTALVAFASALIGALAALLVLPYVAPAYYTNLNPPQVRIAAQPPGTDRTSVAASVFKEVSPAVVAIVNRSTTHTFLGGTQIQEGTGSGVIFDARGYIVTNYHVVAGAQQLTVILPDGQHLPAKLVGGDPPTDLAVVRVDAHHPLPVATFADSAKVVPGQWAIAIGNPLGLDLTQTVTVGVVSGVRTMLYGYGQQQRDTKLIQTDAAINPGNSGGPLCNAAGQVIGLNTWKVAQVQGGGGITAEGIGFAVPSNTVRTVVDDIVRYGRVRRPFLGIQLGISRQAAAMCAATPLEVTHVVAGGPADRAGIRPGDVITTFAGQRVRSYCELIIATDNAKPGETVPVTVIRGGKALTVKVRLGTAPQG